MLSCCIVFLSILFPEKIPVMLQGNSFTSAAKILNLVGGLGFFFGSALFLKYYFRSVNPYYILFANLCLLFGVSALIFEFSQTWDIEWWIWHATRAFAYFIALLFILKVYNNAMDQKDSLLNELQDALKNIRMLKGLVPICTSCKKIRDDKGYWNQIESYIQEHSEAEFSHGLCPECAEKLYPDNNPYKK
jgi:hypothetical protein